MEVICFLFKEIPSEQTRSCRNFIFTNKNKKISNQTIKFT